MLQQTKISDYDLTIQYYHNFILFNYDILPIIKVEPFTQ